MKKNTLSTLSAVLAIIMLIGTLVSCGGNTEDNPKETQASTQESTESSSETSNKTESTSVSEELTSTENKTEDNTSSEDTEKETENNTVTDGSSSEDFTETQSEGSDASSENSNETTTEENTEKETEGAQLSGEHAELIENADALKNGVTAYYTDGTRTGVTFENLEMSLDYNLSSKDSQLVSSLANKKGNAYISNSMDVFVRMTDGKTYYASGSSANAVFNIHRFGYYFYQMRVEGQDFIGELPVGSSLDVNIQKPEINSYVEYAKFKGDYLMAKNSSAAKDPSLTFRNLSVDTSKYSVFEITIRADENASASVDLFYVAGSATGITGEQRIRFSIITDGEWHTYRVPIYTGYDYNGTLSAIRLDVSGSNAEYDLKDVRFLEIDMNGVPSDLSLCRTFNVYSDKMHQTVQIFLGVIINIVT